MAAVAARHCLRLASRRHSCPPSSACTSSAVPAVIIVPRLAQPVLPATLVPAKPARRQGCSHFLQPHGRSQRRCRRLGRPWRLPCPGHTLSSTPSRAAVPPALRKRSWVCHGQVINRRRWPGHAWTLPLRDRRLQRQRQPRRPPQPNLSTHQQLALRLAGPGIRNLCFVSDWALRLVLLLAAACTPCMIASQACCPATSAALVPRLPRLRLLGGRSHSCLPTVAALSVASVISCLLQTTRTALAIKS